MLHRLCEPPSIPLSFSLATILPRRGTSRFPYGREPIGEPPTQCPSFTARSSGGSNAVPSPGFRTPPPFHPHPTPPPPRTPHPPPPPRGPPVPVPVPGWSRGISAAAAAARVH